jgi:tape measure domain-containing protein
MAAPQLRLEVSLNLSGFRSEIQKLTNIAQSEFAPKINVKFNRRTLDTELNNLQAAIKRRVYRIEIGGNIDALPDKIRDLKKELASLESFKIDLGIGAVQSLSKKDASKIKSDLRTEILGGQKKIYVGVSIKPSIARQDVRNFKNAVQSQLTGLSVKVKADLEAASISGGAKSRSDIEADVRRGMEAISEIGAQRMAGNGGGVTEAARREQLRQSLTTGGFGIGGLKDIGKQLGVAGVGRFKNVNNLINKIVTDSSIEMVKKYLDPQAVMRSSDRSGLGKVLDIFARGVFNMLGMDPASIRAQQQSSRQKAFTPAGLLPEYTSRGAREEIMRRLGGADGGRDGKLALSNEAMGQRISAILQEYFKIAEVQVRESFNPRELKQSLNVFSYIVQSLQDAETRTKQARVDESVDSLMNTISQSLKIAEATARIRLAQVRELPQRPSQGMLPGTRIAGLLSPESAGRYRGGGAVETREELFARREREARMRSALRGLSVSSERGLELPGTTFMGDDFTRGGGRDRVTGSGQPPQRGGAIMRHPGGPQLGPASRLPSDYFEKGGRTDQYREGLRLAAAATDSFRAGQIPFLSGLKSIAGEFGEATKQVLLYGTAYKGLAFITSLPGQILNAAKSQQQFNNGLQTATQSTGTFAKELLYVDNVQRAFGLNLQTTRTGFTRLFASMAPTGFDSGSIEKLFTGISAATASLQLTPDKAERVIYAFGQMASKGQIMSEELKGQLGDVLPGALSLFADAAGMSVKEFSEAMEKGEFVGNRFREVFAKVSDELMNRFGTGAQAAARSLQGLINVVGGDFQRTLESFAPLANAAAESILKPLGGAFRQLSVAARLATGEKGRLGGQVTQQEELVRDLGAEASLDGPDAKEAKKQYEGAKPALEALKIELENFNELAKDPAVIKQAENIKAFTDEIGKAASFVQNFVSSIGSALSPILAFLGTNLTSVIGTVISLTLAFQGARLGLLAFVGVMTVIKGAVAAVGLLSLVQQVGSFSAALAVNGTLGKTVATMFTALGVSAKFAGGQIVFASGATMSFGLAAKALLATTGLGLLILVIGSVGAAFAAMGEDAKRAAEDAKQAAKDMAEAARTGNVFQVEAGIRQAQADVPLIKEAQSIVKRGQLGVAFETLDRGTLTEEDQAILSAAGLSLPDGVVYKKDLLKQLNDLLAIRNSVLSKGKAQLALAEQQRKRTGEGIPSLGLQGTEKPEDPDAEKAAQRGKALLDVIEQREEAIAKARKQREDDIAKVRKDAIERAQKLEETFAKQRLDAERRIAQTRRDLAAVREDIGFSSALRTASLTGGDTGAIEAAQRAAQAGRARDEEKRQVEQQILDDQRERAKQIEQLKKDTAKAINEANTRYTQSIGEAQKGYARSVAKIIEEGTGKAAKRMVAAGELAAKYIERASLLQARANVTTSDGSALPIIPRPRASGQNLIYPNLTPDEVPDQFKRIDRRVIELERSLQSLRRTSGIGEQFTAMLSAEGGFEDIAGLEPLPIQKMYQQIGRPFTRLYQQIQDQLTGLYAPSRRQAEKVLKPDPQRTQAVLQRAERVETVRQTWKPLEAESRSRLNQTNPAPRSQPSQASLPTFEKVARDLSGRAFERLNKMNTSIYGILGDISDYLTEGERAVLKKGIAEQLKQGVQPARIPVGGNINTGRAHLTTAVRELTQEILGNSKSIPRAPAPSALPESSRQLLLPLGDDSEWRKRFMEQTEPIQIIPGVQNRIEGASLPGGSFDVKKIATDFGTIAAASILRGVLDVSRIPEASRSAQIAQVQSLPTVPFSQPVDMPGAAATTTQLQNTSQAVDNLGVSLKNVSSKLSDTNFFKTYTDELQRATSDLAGARKQAEDDVNKLNRILSLRRGGLTGDQAERLDAANEISRKALSDATSEYEAKLKEAEGDPALQKEITDEFERTATEIQKAYTSLVQFNDQLNNMPLELELEIAVQDLRDKLNDLISPANQVKGAANAIGDAFGEAFKGVITGSMTAREALAGMFQNIGNYFADLVAQMIAEYLKMQLIEGIMSIFSFLSPGFGTGIAPGPVAKSAGVKFSPTKLGPAFANGGIASGGFTAFANGGIVTGPTLGLVGEGRYNEAVIPLPDGKSVPVDLGGAMAGGMGGEVTSNIVVNINNGQMQGNGNSNGSELGRKIEGAVKQVLVSELRPGGILSSGRR